MREGERYRGNGHVGTGGWETQDGRLGTASGVMRTGFLVCSRGMMPPHPPSVASCVYWRSYLSVTRLHHHILDSCTALSRLGLGLLHRGISRLDWSRLILFPRDRVECFQLGRIESDNTGWSGVSLYQQGQYVCLPRKITSLWYTLKYRKRRLDALCQLCFTHVAGQS